MLLVGVLEVYNCMSVLIHHLARRVNLLMDVVPRALSLAEAMVHNLQLSILVCRRNRTTTEKIILAL
jgi:hypothetical protein